MNRGESFGRKIQRIYFKYYIRETYDRQKADVKTKQKELQNMEDSLTQKVITIIIYFSTV